MDKYVFRCLEYTDTDTLESKSEYEKENCDCRRSDIIGIKRDKKVVDKIDKIVGVGGMSNVDDKN